MGDFHAGTRRLFCVVRRRYCRVLHLAVPCGPLARHMRRSGSFEHCSWSSGHPDVRVSAASSFLSEIAGNTETDGHPE